MCLTVLLYYYSDCRYRPLAPSVLVEHASDWFENIPTGPDADISPYMSITTNIKEDKAPLIPAVCHIDNSARLQTVSKDTNPLYHALIQHFFKLTKVGDKMNKYCDESSKIKRNK